MAGIAGLACAVGAVGVVGLACEGCAARVARAPTPYEPMSESKRNPLRAQELNMEAAGLLDSDPKRAEALLREALGVDLYYGPAHNNLGIMFLGRGALYEAAAEFEWARKLAPGSPNPRMNLALTLERGGRIDDALTAFGEALAVAPEHMPTIQATARLQLKAGRSDGRTRAFLEDIALRGEDEAWKRWAREQLASSP